MFPAQKSRGLVPLSSSQAGSCLTFANWQEAGIQTLSFHITDLLLKPGLAVLQSLTDIRGYFNYPGDVIINAALLPKANRENEYRIRSPYDGSVIRIEGMALLALIARLKPEKVILPSGSARYFSQLNDLFSEETLLYFHFSDESPEIAGKSGRYSLSGLADISNCPLPCYAMGEFDAKQLFELAQWPDCLFESDKPAHDGMMGLVYGSDGLLNILDADRMQEHWPLDTHCHCPTCISQLTRAYLHHLLQYTPLLAQRYLIRHNIYFCQNHFHLREGEIPL